MPYAHLFLTLSSHIESFIVSGGYPLLFLIVILEGLPLVGTAIPGHVTIIAAGFLSRLGVFNLYWVLVITIVAALVGDFIGFMLGRKYGMSLITRLRPYFFIKDSHIEKAKQMLDTHTGKAMFFGRFSPVTRALMPFLVGTGEISVGKFWAYNILSGVSWVVSSVLLGYVFGAGYHVVARYFGRFAVIAILIAIVIAWGYRFVNSRFHIFARYELITLGLNVVALIALAKTIQDAWAVKSFMASFDVVVNVFMDKINHLYPVLVTLATWMTNVGGTAVTTCLGVLFGIVLLFRKQWRLAFIFLLSMMTTAFALGILKEFFMRVRPDNALIIMVNDPSFPSGHAGMAAAFFVVLAYFLAPKIHSWVKRELMIIICVLIVFAIGLSRLILNVHWTSDVIAGWSLGVFMATGSILLVRYLGALVTRKKV
jgi:undecaprenyl-diphosphatase